jgi:class 3 adenylate cyclase
VDATAPQNKWHRPVAAPIREGHPDLPDALRERLDRQVEVPLAGGDRHPLIADGRIDLWVRMGLHTGMIAIGRTGLKILVNQGYPSGIVVIGDELGGTTVTSAARITSLAKAGQVLASAAVKDLVAGFGITCESRGVHRFEGTADDCALFTVVGESAS